MRTPFTTTTMDRPVNLFRAITTCNSFYIFLSAAKAALLPFLTLFFYIIGLTAMETGIIMAAKTLTGFIWAPLWARCAVAYNKRRLVLVFSLLMMGAMYMSFTAVYYKVGITQTCHPAGSQNQEGGNGTSLMLNSTNTSLTDTDKTESQVNAEHVTIPGPSQESTTQSGIHPNNIVENGGEGPALEVNSSKPTTPSNPGHSIHATPAPDTAQPTPPLLSTQVVDEPENHNESGETIQSILSDADFEQIEQLIEERTHLSLEEMANQGMNASNLYRRLHTLIPELPLTEEDSEYLLQKVQNKPSSDQPKAKRSLNRFPRNLNFTFLNTWKSKIGDLTSTLEEKQLLLFLVVLLVVIFGEFFSSPVEKIADDAWFDFLERIDDMEKYGRQRYWGSLTFALVPIIVTAMVDYTPCTLIMNLHHFLLHFFVFGIFITFTIFLAFYFPMPPPVKQKYSSKIGKALRVICCDARGFLFVTTLLIAGSVYASFNNFLFWHLYEMGSSEITMGLCVSIGAFAETPMLVFSNRLVRKLGNGGVVSLSLAVLALRVLFYGFLWTPWAVLPAEITNAFTHTALWYAVLSYDEFNVGSAMDRSIRSILSSVYFGLGFSVGSFISGVVYYTYGSSVLFWGASVLSGGWCLLYSLIQCCLPKKERVKYIKLLRKEEDDSSDDDDDWLEMALKDQ